MSVLSRLLGIVIGAALLALVVVAWRLGSGAADVFAPALALAGVGALLLGTPSVAGRSRLPRTTLLVAGWGALALAVAAALSLGTFLPPLVAGWASPALGRFGALPAFLMLLGGVVLHAALDRSARRSRLFNLGMACLLAAFWVGSQVERQVRFPPPPTTAAELDPRLDLLFALALSLAVAALLTWGLGERQERAGSTEMAEPAATPETTSWLDLCGWLWRWTLLLTVIGLIASLVVGAPGWYRFGTLAILLLLGAIVRMLLIRREVAVRNPLAGVLKTGGRLVAALLGVALVYFLTGEDLEVVMLRNTAEYQAGRLWRGALGDDRFATQPVGTFSGVVWDQFSRGIAGATVLVSDAQGQVFSAETDSNGTYRIENVPEGSYLPLAIAPGYQYAPPFNAQGRVATVRPGRETRDLYFQLAPRPAPVVTGDGQLTFGEPTTVHVDNPQPSDATRRSFTFENRGKLLEGGLMYEPPAEMGNGPFPILLIIFPGAARLWEGISVPLSASGYVVISYFPVRLLDMEGDISDLALLLRMAGAGKMSTRGDSTKLGLLGGSVSTAYTYRMALDTEGAAIRARLRASLQYGGLFDMFHFRHSWETGAVIIDPGISELEYLLMAFGRPDTRPELYMFLSPRYTLGSNTLPPTLLVHAGHDIIVPFDQTVIAGEILTKLGSPHDLRIYHDLEHYLDVSKADPRQVEMLNEALTFLSTYFSDPAGQ